MNKPLLHTSVKPCKIDVRKGFTLAEILISLMILGVIASLTIPSLIQNTHKKEEVVKIKKGLSVINQAIAMDKALTGEDLSQYGDVYQFETMFKKRLSVIDSAYEMVGMGILLQDGAGFFIDDNVNSSFRSTEDISNSNYYIHIVLSTKQNDQAYKILYSNQECSELSGYTRYGHLGTLCGAYDFYCGYDMCIPSEDTAAIINSTDPTKAE